MYFYNRYFIIVLQFKLVLLINNNIDEMNVGTVLFTKKDYTRKCWTNEQLVLLRARLIYQDILPKTSSIDLKDDQFLIALVNYFHLAISKVKSVMSGQTQHINLMAMCDVIGGYLRSVLIPLTKRAFYDGNINFDTTRNVLKFYNDIKLFLHTDGTNWANPNDATIKRILRQTPTRNCIKSGDVEANLTCDQLTYTNNNNFIYIPMPFFDSKTTPSSIAVPFKHSPLRKLDRKNAVYILAKYYVAATKCLQEKNAQPYNVERFNKDFETFLDTEVVPHLTDEQLYPAFGSVYKIKDTINNRAMNGPGAIKNPKIRQDDQFAQNNTIKTSIEATELQHSDDSDVNKNEDSSDDNAPVIVLICLSVVAALWLFITMYYCMKNRRTKPQTSDKSLNTVAPKKSPSETKISSSVPDASVNQRNSKRLSFKESGEPVAPESQKKKNKCHLCKKKQTPTTTKRAIIEKCSKCNRKHCRCINSIWSTLSNYTVTYPRLFPKKQTATSGLLQKYAGMSRDDVPAVLCPVCKRTKCHHMCLSKLCSDKSDTSSSTRAQNHFMMKMASLLQKSPAKTIKSAPVTTTCGKNEWATFNESFDTTMSTATNKRASDETVVVFGYDFETSSSDDDDATSSNSSLDDSTPSV